MSKKTKAMNKNPKALRRWYIKNANRCGEHYAHKWTLQKLSDYFMA